MLTELNLLDCDFYLQSQRDFTKEYEKLTDKAIRVNEPEKLVGSVLWRNKVLDLMQWVSLEREDVDFPIFFHDLRDDLEKLVLSGKPLTSAYLKDVISTIEQNTLKHAKVDKIQPYKVDHPDIEDQILAVICKIYNHKKMNPILKMLAIMTSLAATNRSITTVSMKIVYELLADAIACKYKLTPFIFVSTYGAAMRAVSDFNKTRVTETQEKDSFYSSVAYFQRVVVHHYVANNEHFKSILIADADKLCEGIFGPSLVDPNPLPEVKFRTDEFHRMTPKHISEFCDPIHKEVISRPKYCSDEELATLVSFITRVATFGESMFCEDSYHADLKGSAPFTYEGGLSVVTLVEGRLNMKTPSGLYQKVAKLLVKLQLDAEREEREKQYEGIDGLDLKKPCSLSPDFRSEKQPH